jgi:hypothetical protein
MYLVGTYFLLLNPTWLQIFKIQSKDAVKINFGLVELIKKRISNNE